MYIVVEKNYHIFSESNRIGAVSQDAKIYYTPERVHSCSEGKFYDIEGNEITNVTEITDDYVDLNALVTPKTLEVNKQYEITLPVGRYRLYKDGNIVNMFELTEPKTLKLSFKAVGSYQLEIDEKPFNPAYFIAVEPIVEVIEIG